MAINISPTDISQFIRLEQCNRYLSLRLREKAEGDKFIADYGVTPQTLPPLLTISGGDFEKEMEDGIAITYPVINFASQLNQQRNRQDNNQDLIDTIQNLRRGETIVLFQSRIRVNIKGWQINGDIDLVRIEKSVDEQLHLLIVDMKSSNSVKIEHRLQVAFYYLMLENLLLQTQIINTQLEIGILYSGPSDPSKLIDKAEIDLYEAHHHNSNKFFGLSEGLLELITEPEIYLNSVEDLVTGNHSTTSRIINTPFSQLPFTLSYKCDSCLYNEYCMKWSAENDDLSLLPYLTANDKNVLKRNGVDTVRQLALLKDIERRKGVNEEESIELIPSTGNELLAKKLAITWPIGPRLDELIHRAKRYRAWKKDPIEALNYIPTKGYGSLPYCDEKQNPNLVRIYIDAQYDYLHERIYLLGALVVASENGNDSSIRRRTIVQLTDGPPDHLEKERQLFVRWINETLKAIVELAAPDKDGKPRAPIHIIFFNRLEQKLMLDGLSRHFSTVLGTTPLYDFMTQLAAYDSPIATFLDEEIRELKNYPIVCQSLASVAAYLKFDWNKDKNYREIFKERIFDFWGKLKIADNSDNSDNSTQWYTHRARFNSLIPLEYAYAAWQLLPYPQNRDDLFEEYRQVNIDLLKDFQARRLEALEWIAKDFRGNKLTEKQSFHLPDLARFTDKARTLAAALDEFLTIERHVELNEWKAIRHIAPERRVLMGETLLVHYYEIDQDPEIALLNREYERRRLLKEEYRATYLAANPQAKKVMLTPSEKEETSWSWEGMPIRLRLETTGLDCNLDEMLGLCKIETGNRMIIYPRWTVDERLPVAERKEFTPTPKQMLYGSRADITKIEIEREETGKATGGYIEVTMKTNYFKSPRGYLFTSIDKPFIEGKLYTLDNDPNNIYGYWCSQITEALCNLEDGKIDQHNTLYDRIAYPHHSQIDWPDAAITGQKRFLAGLDALIKADLMHEFEASKRDFIASHGTDPILLVQGPPGTGKSYSTAFAIFARLQGAISANKKFHIYLSCKTHAATDVLLSNVLAVQEKLKEFFQKAAHIFKTYFDIRLLCTGQKM